VCRPEVRVGAARTSWARIVGTDRRQQQRQQQTWCVDYRARKRQNHAAVAVKYLVSCMYSTGWADLLTLGGKGH